MPLSCRFVRCEHRADPLDNRPERCPNRPQSFRTVPDWLRSAPRWLRLMPHAGSALPVFPEEVQLRGRKTLRDDDRFARRMFRAAHGEVSQMNYSMRLFSTLRAGLAMRSSPEAGLVGRSRTGRGACHGAELTEMMVEAERGRDAKSFHDDLAGAIRDVASNHFRAAAWFESHGTNRANQPPVSTNVMFASAHRKDIGRGRETYTGRGPWIQSAWQ
jgi:hypothetical protein